MIYAYSFLNTNVSQQNQQKEVCVPEQLWHLK